LAAEALRGAGGILLNAEGKRFCDELGRRDTVFEAMTKQKGPFYLVLNKGSAKEVHWHCEHYVARNLMKKYKSGIDLAKEMKIHPSTLEETFNKYNEDA